MDLSRARTSTHARRRTVTAVAVALALLTIAGRLEGGALPPPERPARAHPPAAGPARRLPALAAIPLGGNLAGAAGGAGALWALRSDGVLLRVDPASHRATAQLRVTRPGLPSGAARVTVGDGAVWVSTADSPTTRLDPASMRVTGTVAAPVELAADGALWGRCCPEERAFTLVVRTDPARLLASRPIRPGPRLVAGGGDADAIPSLAVGGGAIWTTELDGGRVWRSDERGRHATSFPVPGVARRVVVDRGAVWVLCTQVLMRARAGGTRPGPALVRLDPASGRIRAVVDLPELDESGVSGPVRADGALWLLGGEAAGGGSVLERVDPQGGRVSGAFDDDRRLFPLLAGTGGLWAFDLAGGALLELDGARLRPWAPALLRAAPAARGRRPR
jgi:phage baseplate assembly protein gpV